MGGAPDSFDTQPRSTDDSVYDNVAMFPCPRLFVMLIDKNQL